MKCFERPQREFATVMLLILLVLSLAACSAEARPSAVAPFVQELEIEVFDPAQSDSTLPTIQRFTHLVVLTSENGILASFEAIDGRAGVLLLDGPSLALVDIYWLDAKEAAVRYTWDAAASIGPSSAVFVAGSSQSAVPGEANVISVIYRGDAESTGENSGGGGTPGTWQERSIALPERIAAATVTIDGETLVGLTRPSNWVVRWRLDGVEPQVTREVFGFVPYAYPAGRCLWTADDGSILGSYKGRLFRYHPDSEFFEYLGMLPCEFGHLSETALSAVAGGNEGSVAGGVAGDAYLFTLDLETRSVTSHGRPTDGTEIRALVHGGDGAFWGIAATPGQSCRLFRFDPANGELRDLGVPAGTLFEDGRRFTWHAFDVTDMAVLPDGRIVLAEAAPQAKLLVFDPQSREKP